MKNVYMILVGPSGSVFVKDLKYFRSQGGFKDSWGRNWKPIVADSIEHARELGCDFPGAKPFNQQAK